MKQKKLRKLAKLTVELLNESCTEYHSDCPQCPFGYKGVAPCSAGVFGNKVLRMINNGKKQ